MEEALGKTVASLNGSGWVNVTLGDASVAEEALVLDYSIQSPVEPEPEDPGPGPSPADQSLFHASYQDDEASAAEDSELSVSQFGLQFDTQVQGPSQPASPTTPPSADASWRLHIEPSPSKALYSFTSIDEQDLDSPPPPEPSQAAAEEMGEDEPSVSQSFHLPDFT